MFEGRSCIFLNLQLPRHYQVKHWDAIWHKSLSILILFFIVSLANLLLQSLLLAVFLPRVGIVRVWLFIGQCAVKSWLQIPLPEFHLTISWLFLLQLVNFEMGVAHLRAELGWQLWDFRLWCYVSGRSRQLCCWSRFCGNLNWARIGTCLICLKFLCLTISLTRNYWLIWSLEWHLSLARYCVLAITQSRMCLACHLVSWANLC